MRKAVRTVYLIEGKENLRGNMTTVALYIRGCQEEKVLSCSPFPPEIGKRSTELRLKQRLLGKTSEL